MQSLSRGIASRTHRTDSVRRMSCMYHATCPLPGRFTSFINRYVMHIIYCAQVRFCSHVEIDRLFSHSQYPSYYLAPNYASQSHLHIGLPFGTPISCLQLEQVMIPLALFSPTLRVVSFTISFDEWTTKLFPVFYRLFYFSPCCFYRSIFFLFHCVTLHPHRISNSDAIRNSLSVPADRAGRSWVRDCCMFFRSQVWSMRGQHNSCPIDRLTFRSFVLLFPRLWRCSAPQSHLDAIRNFTIRASRSR